MYHAYKHTYFKVGSANLMHNPNPNKVQTTAKNIYILCKWTLYKINVCVRTSDFVQGGLVPVF